MPTETLGLLERSTVEIEAFLVDDSNAWLIVDGRR